MKIDRISLQLADEVRSFDLHHGLTVIEAAGGTEYPLARALVGTLGRASDGVHVEFCYDDGRAFVAFRPTGAPPRVIGIDDAADHTGAFRRSDGGVDVLAAWRPKVSGCERFLLVSRADVSAGDPTDAWVAQLSGLDSSALVAAAEEEIAAEEALRQASGRVGNALETVAAVERVEATRSAAVDAERQHTRMRVAALAAGTTLPVAAVIGAFTEAMGTPVALGVLGGSLAITVGCLVAERRAVRAIDAEATAMAALSVGSYEEFTAEMAGSEATDPEVRANLLAAAERFRDAAATWQQVAGDVPAAWVARHRNRIERARQLLTEVAPLEPGAPAPLDISPGASAAMATLVDRAAGLRLLGGINESLPLVIEDPLADLTPAEKAPMLEFLHRLARRQQVLLVSSDAEVLEWARLEALAGHVGAIVSEAAAGEAGGAAAGNGALAGHGAVNGNGRGGGGGGGQASGAPGSARG